MRVTFDLLRWAADYYHHPLGEVMAAALPASLRAGQAALAPVEVWSLTSAGRSELERPAAKRAPKRRELLARLAERDGTTADDLAGFKPALLRALAENGWAVPQALPAAPVAVESRPSEVVLTAAQAGVIEAIRPSLGRFAAHLLYGVTGSGKTEVYLQDHHRRAGGRPPGAGSGARDRAHAAAGRALSAPFQRGCGRRAFRADGSPAPRRVARCARRRSAHRHRHALGGVHPARALEPHRGR